MDRMIVAVFDPLTRAVDGQYALRRLDAASTIALYASALIDKAADGGVEIRQQSRDAGVETSDSAIAAIIGLLGGPIRAALDAGAGDLLGGLLELDTARIGADFLDDIGSVLTPGRSAVVAVIDEECTAPVDDAVAALGGLVFRRTLTYDSETQAQRSIDALKGELALLKAELAIAAPERHQPLQARIDSAEARLARELADSKAHREAIRRQADARLGALRAKAGQSTGDLKAKQEQRIVAVERAYGEWLDRMDGRAEGGSSGR